MIIISLLMLSSLLPHLSFSASVNVGIVNGSVARPHSRPYMVSIQENNKHVCGGFLISDESVLTAAHCRINTETLTVVAGAHDLTNKTEQSVRISVRSYNKHPDYKSDPNKPAKADLMILKLDQKVLLNNKIKTIGIPSKPVEIKVDTVCSVAGWGRVMMNRPLSSKLREVNMKIMNNTDCAARWGWEYEASGMMCAYGYGGTCEGDSGGPLVCNNIAVGITSFNDKNICNHPDRPGVFTKTSAFLQWIQNTTSNADFCI